MCRHEPPELTETSLNQLINGSALRMMADLLDELQDVIQYCPDAGDVSPSAYEIILASADSYRIAAIIYLRCSILGRVPLVAESELPLILRRDVPQNEDMATLRAQLFDKLRPLPTRGPLFTAIYPLWSLFIYCVTAIDPPERVVVCEILRDLYHNSSRSVGQLRRRAVVDSR